MHPEYHALLEAPDGSLDREYLPDQGDVNPFLHLSLHLALAEQLAIEQPPGIRAHYARLTASPARAEPAPAGATRAPATMRSALGVDRRGLLLEVCGDVLDVLLRQRGSEAVHDRILACARLVVA